MTNFTLNVVKCINVADDMEVDLGHFIYNPGDERIELATVERLSTNCNISVLSVANGLNPEFTVVISSDMVTVSLESSEITAGDYAVTVLETDPTTGSVVSTIFTVTVLEPETASEFTIIVEQEFEADPQDEPSLEDETTDDEIAEAEESEPDETEDSEPIVTIGENGKPIYPWQNIVVRTSRKQERDVQEKKIVPLKVFAKDMSASGTLKIGFNKPILMPPIKVEAEKNSTRLLQDDKFEEQGSESSFTFDINSVLDLEVESSFFEKGSSEISILNYTLAGMTERELDIRVNF